ncbi:MAG: radical SAM protein [Alphaproteobacteria bacterium]|nr:radical SAM protein [Alphaproteobacteria bacterium]
MVGVYLIPSYFCSVGCEHCYLPEEIRAKKEVMSEEVLRQTARFLKAYASSFGKEEKITIIWHGGEPLMSPLSFYEKAIPLLKETLGDFSQSMQTSLLPLKEEYLPFIKENMPHSLGVSLDFTLRTIQGSNQKYQEKFWKKWDDLKAYGIEAAMTCVPCKADLKKIDEMIEAFLAHEVYFVQFERYIDVGKRDLVLMPTNEEYAAFLKEMFLKVMSLFETKGYRLFVRIFADVIKGVLYQTSSGVYGGNCQAKLITITPKGEVFLCPNRASYETPYANVSDGFSVFENAPRRLGWILRQHLKNETKKCWTCPYNSWCKGACPIAPQEGIVLPSDTECRGYKGFIDFVKEFSLSHKDVLENYLLGKKDEEHLC